MPSSGPSFTSFSASSFAQCTFARAKALRAPSMQTDLFMAKALHAPSMQMDQTEVAAGQGLARPYPDYKTLHGLFGRLVQLDQLL